MISEYTTGEVAKICGVSVRTVQYYNSRNILVPSKLSEGGRRLYSEDDLKRMKIICFLREADIPIYRIEELFNDRHPDKIISALLNQQEYELRDKIETNKKRLGMIENIREELKEIEHFSIDSIGDIASIMKQKNKHKKMLRIMRIIGIPLNALQWISVYLWITKGNWKIFMIWFGIAILLGIALSVYYHRHIAYICPECHEVFRPRFKEVFWAYHTSKMRKLTCMKCGRKGLCIEIYHPKEI